MRIIVADTTPLIFMAKLTLLELLSSRVSIVVPEDVAREATRRQDLVDARYIQRLIEEKKLAVRRVPTKNIAAFEQAWGLGRGEAAAIALSIREKATMMTDDFAAIRVAKALKLTFVTTPIMIVTLQKRNLISLELARAKITELSRHVWLGQNVVTGALKMLEGGR